MKQKEKEAEILVLKYALVEMDRKFQEIEKKQKTGVSNGKVGGLSRVGITNSRVVNRTSLASAKGSKVNTPRENSRVIPKPQVASATVGRERSKTPSAMVSSSRGGL